MTTARTQRRMDLFLKRSFDLCFSLVALVLVSPILVVVSILIWATMGRPIFFRQVRAGKDGCRLRVWKFRTMTNAVSYTHLTLPTN